MANTSELQLMSNVFELLGTSTLEQSPLRQRPDLEASALDTSTAGRGVFADPELEAWVHANLGRQQQQASPAGDQPPYGDLGSTPPMPAAPQASPSTGLGGSYHHRSAAIPLDGSLEHPQAPPMRMDPYAGTSPAVLPPHQGFGAAPVSPSNAPVAARATPEPSDSAAAVTAAVLAWQQRAQRDAAAIDETSAALIKVRSTQMAQIDEAITVLREEEEMRKRRCNALAAEIREIDAKKERLMMGLVEGGSDELGMLGTSGDGRTLLPGDSGAAKVVYSYDSIVSGFQRKKRVMTANSPGSRRAAADRTGGANKGEAAIPVPVACGPLTRTGIETHHQQHLESQRQRQMRLLRGASGR